MSCCDVSGVGGMVRRRAFLALFSAFAARGVGEDQEGIETCPTTRLRASARVHGSAQALSGGRVDAGERAMRRPDRGRQHLIVCGWAVVRKRRRDHNGQAAWIGGPLPAVGARKLSQVPAVAVSGHRCGRAACPFCFDVTLDARGPTRPCVFFFLFLAPACRLSVALCLLQESIVASLAPSPCRSLFSVSSAVRMQPAPFFCATPLTPPPRREQLRLGYVTSPTCASSSQTKRITNRKT